MTLVQILLPVRDGEGRPFARAEFARVRDELTETFGGATLHFRSPAQGAWTNDDGAVERDDVVIAEVLVKRVDREWWKLYREDLAARFRQDEMHIRALPVDLL